VYHNLKICQEQCIISKRSILCDDNTMEKVNIQKKDKSSKRSKAKQNHFSKISFCLRNKMKNLKIDRRSIIVSFKRAAIIAILISFPFSVSIVFEESRALIKEKIRSFILVENKHHQEVVLDKINQIENSSKEIKEVFENNNFRYHRIPSDDKMEISDLIREIEMKTLELRTEHLQFQNDLSLQNYARKYPIDSSVVYESWMIPVETNRLIRSAELFLLGAGDKKTQEKILKKNFSKLESRIDQVRSTNIQKQ